MAESLCTCEDFVSGPCPEHAIRLDNWQLAWMPGKRGYRLEGVINEKNMYTKRLVQSSGLFALTVDGTWYLLQIPRASWLRQQARNKHVFDFADPLKIKGRQ